MFPFNNSEDDDAQNPPPRINTSEIRTIHQFEMESNQSESSKGKYSNYYLIFDELFQFILMTILGETEKFPLNNWAVGSYEQESALHSFSDSKLNELFAMADHPKTVASLSKLLPGAKNRFVT